MKGYWKETKPEDFEVGDLLDTYTTDRENPEECFRVVRVENDEVTTVDNLTSSNEYTWNPCVFYKWIEEKPKMKKIEKDGWYDIWEGQKYIGRDHEKAGVEYGEELTYVLVDADKLPAPPAVTLDDGVYFCTDVDDDYDFMVLEKGVFYVFNWNTQGRGDEGVHLPYTPVKRVRFEDV
jgi:hypothetical protein